MAEDDKKGFVGKLVDAITDDEDERRRRMRAGEKHDGVLGKIEGEAPPEKEGKERLR